MSLFRKDAPDRIRRGVARGRRVVGIDRTVAERREREPAPDNLLHRRPVLPRTALAPFVAIRVAVEKAHGRIVHERMVAAEVRIHERRHGHGRLGQIHEHVERVRAARVPAAHDVLATLRRTAKRRAALHQVKCQPCRLGRQPSVDVRIEELNHTGTTGVSPVAKPNTRDHRNGSP